MVVGVEGTRIRMNVRFSCVYATGPFGKLLALELSNIKISKLYFKQCNEAIKGDMI